MLTLKTHKSLCSSLHHSIRNESGTLQTNTTLTDIRFAVAHAFGFDSNKAITQHLKTSSIEISPQFCKAFCEVVKEHFDIDYQHSVFTFKWPNDMSFTANEVGQFWQDRLALTKLRMGADIYRILTPVMQYKRGSWIVAPESTITVGQINSVIGEGIAILDESHTDIVMRLNESAASGDINAMHGIAQRYLATAQNAKAFDVLNSIISLDDQHQHALADLAMLYMLGIEGHLEVDIYKAEQLYLQSASLGSAQAAHVLGVSYDINGSFTHDYRKAFEYHKLAIDLGNHASVNCLITMLIYERGIIENTDSEYLNDLFDIGLELQDPESIQRLADYYENGKLVSLERVFELREACVNLNRNTERVHLELARMYLHGNGCEKDVALAMKHYQKEIELFNCADSMKALADIHQAEFDDTESYHTLLDKALNNISDSTTSAVQIYYLSGYFAMQEKKPEQAEALFLKALNYSNLSIEHHQEPYRTATEKVRLMALFYIGLIHYYDFNNDSGLQLIQEASARGCIPAKYRLAMISLEDFNNLIQCEMLLRQAKEAGDQQAAAQYNSLFSTALSEG